MMMNSGAKIEVWKKSLLDISTRNRLISVSEDNKHISLANMDEDMFLFLNGLLEGNEYRILPWPDGMKSDGDGENAEEKAELKDETKSVLHGELSKNHLRTGQTEKTHMKTLANICKEAKTQADETGTNVLYLGCGFLQWYENHSDKARYAPILLIPVKLQYLSNERAYTVSMGTGEITINKTLLEMLRRNFDMNIEFDESKWTNESGEIADPQAVLEEMKELIKHQENWSVIKSFMIGIFSFGNYGMWNDMNEHPEIFEQHPVTNSLISGSLGWVAGKPFCEVSRLDELTAPEDVITVLPADSSQLNAVLAAGKGESFVLDGPPGTGKSQTITNIIANSIYKGKRVLFVAKKKEALQVVQKRLEECGLGPYCLELYSDKATKMHLVNQVKAALSQQEMENPRTYKEKAQALLRQRNTLADTIAQFQSSTECQKSIVELLEMQNNPTNEEEENGIYIDFSKVDLSLVKAADLEKWEEAIRDYANLFQKAGEGCEIFKNIGLSAVTNAQSKSMKERIRRYQEQSKSLADMMHQIYEYFEFEGFDQGKASEYVKVAYACEHIPHIPEEMRNLFENGMTYEEYISRARRAEVIAATEARFEGVFLKQYLAEPYLEKWTRYHSDTSFLGKKIKKQILEELNDYTKTDDVIKEEEVVDILQNLLAYETYKDELDAQKEQQEEAAPEDTADQKETEESHYISEEEWEIYEESYEKYLRLIQRVHEKIEFSEEDLENVCDFISKQLCEESYEEGEEHDFFEEFHRLYSETRDILMELLVEVKYIPLKGDLQDKTIMAPFMMNADVENEIAGWIEHLNKLPRILVCMNARKDIKALGLESACIALEKKESLEAVLAEFYSAFSNAYLEYVIENNPVLSNFSSLNQEISIEKYYDSVKQFQKLMREKLLYQMRSSLPDISNGVTEDKELALLMKVIYGGGKRMSIRQMMCKMPRAINRLCPVLLMSPSSVASYLDIDFPKADLLIIDEASQLETCEAVGSIVRANQLVVCGDANQLPPTSYFDNQLITDDIEQEDLDSILEDCLALMMPETCLNYHYRSNHESLISFSNMAFYENRMNTYPSANAGERKVSFVKVEEGVYDRGGTRTNIREAQGIIKTVKEHLLDENDHRSIGVITFNLAQKNLIEEMLMEEISQDHELEKCMEAYVDPIFIKNLETVQGDERDIILFSLGYGPDAEGKMSMNFGPVNQKGGHRRINVAVTRAREEMEVYCSFEPEALKITERDNKGLETLKEFLTYAKYGSLPMKKKEANRESMIIDRIAEALEAEGYQTDTNIGTSQNKIHIGVKNQDHPEEYMMGIILGDRKPKNATISDTYVINPDVFAKKGWKKLMRIWSIDWCEDPEMVISNILEELAAA